MSEVININIWDVLGIEATTDIKKIKRAYAARTKECHPEDEPEKFKILQTCYKAAISYANNPPEQETDWQMWSGEPSGNDETPSEGAAESPYTAFFAESMEEEKPQEEEKYNFEYEEVGNGELLYDCVQSLRRDIKEAPVTAHRRIISEYIYESRYRELFSEEQSLRKIVEAVNQMALDGAAVEFLYNSIDLGYGNPANDEIKSMLRRHTAEKKTVAPQQTAKERPARARAKTEVSGQTVEKIITGIVLICLLIIGGGNAMKGMTAEKTNKVTVAFYNMETGEKWKVKYDISEEEYNSGSACIEVDTKYTGSADVFVATRKPGENVYIIESKYASTSDGIVKIRINPQKNYTVITGATNDDIYTYTY